MYKCHAGEAGTLWSFNFFLYNRKAKRMLYFSCRGVSKSVGSSESRFRSSPGARPVPIFVLRPAKCLSFSLNRPKPCGCMEITLS